MCILKAGPYTIHLGVSRHRIPPLQNMDIAGDGHFHLVLFPQGYMVPGVRDVHYYLPVAQHYVTFCKRPGIDIPSQCTLDHVLFDRSVGWRDLYRLRSDNEQHLIP